MTIRSTEAAALLLATSLLPAIAGGVEVGGHVGFGYQQADSWSLAGERTREPHLDIDLALDARGLVVRRDIANWALAAGYRRVDDGTGTSERRQRFISYSGRAGLFTGARSPLTLSLDSSRGQANFYTGSGLDQTGASFTTSYGAMATLRGGTTPPLVLGYRWTDSLFTAPGLPDRTRTTQGFTAGSSLGNASFNLAAGYEGQLNEGNWATDRYAFHNANVSAKIPMKEGQLFFEERFQALTPKELVLGTVDQQNNAFRAGAFNGGSFGTLQSATYSYLRSVSQGFAAPLNESTRQGLSYQGDLFLTDPGFFTRWLLDASLGQVRSNGSEIRSTGETLGTQLWWRRQGGDVLYQFYGGPLVGLVQSDTASSDFGWGLTGAGRVQHPLGSQLGQAEYIAEYGSRLFGSEGTSLRQTARLSLSGALGRGAYQASLGGSAFRTSSPLFGDGAGRTLDLSVTGSSRDVTYQIRGSLEQGVAGATPREFAADGLFIPAPYDSTARQLLVGSTVTLYTGLTLTGHLRYLSTDFPGQPAVNQAEGFASLQYRYGALVFALEDRIDRYQQGGGGSWTTANLVIARVFRTFGWR